MGGNQCTCFETIPLDNLQQVREDGCCLDPCAGDSNYLCGGTNSVSVYVASNQNNNHHLLDLKWWQECQLIVNYGYNWESEMI